MNDLTGKRFKLDYSFDIEQLYALTGHYSSDLQAYYLYDFYCYVRDLLFVLNDHLCSDEIPDLEAPADE